MTTRTLTSKENKEIDDVFDAMGCRSTKIKADFKTRFATLKSEAERKLIMDLTRRFVYIPLSDYGTHLIPTIQLYLSELRTNRRIAVMNGFHKSDFGKVKSNYLVSYQFKGLNLVKHINWGSKSPRIIEDFKSLLKTKNIQELELLLVDDFIGSGETIEGAYNYILQRLKVYKKPMPHVSVVCIVAMRQAVELLAKMDIQVYASRIVSRGISDFYSGDDLSNAVALMNDIENRINVKSDFKLGYKHSEALVCMERCPNNTFPFYWFNDNHGNPPFRR